MASLGVKRGRAAYGAVNGSNGAAAVSKKPKEMESSQSGIGSKSKPCTKFFSTVGCPFGEGCHFLHYVPGGINAVAKMINLSNLSLPTPRNTIVPSQSDVSTPPVAKSRMCNKYNTPGGCKFGDKCHFAHGDRELGRSMPPLHDDHSVGPFGGRLGGRIDPPPSAGLGAAASFGASATAKISVDASLAGAIIGKGGVNSKQICRLTGAKLSIKEHETDPNLRNIELEGTFDQIKQASAMVRELIVNVSATTPLPSKNHHTPTLAAPGGNYKTKPCENFPKGSCTFGDRCHFAHGASELRRPGI